MARTSEASILRGYEKTKQWRLDNPEKAKRSMRNTDLKRRYGITLDDYERMYEEQEGRCLMCGDPFDGTACVDHDHDTGAIRGLLHGKCNTDLGTYEKVKDMAEAYLNRNWY